MRSTGEVMGIARDFPTAFAKAQAAAGAMLPQSGTVFITRDRRRQGRRVGRSPRCSATSASAIVATAGTAQAIRGMGVRVDAVLKKIGEGSPNVADCIEAGEVDLIINTPTGSGARADGWEIRRAATARGIPCITTLPAATPRRGRSPRRAPASPRCCRCRRSTASATAARERAATSQAERSRVS